MASARLIGEILLRRGSTFHYGPDRSQCGELYRPRASADELYPVLIAIHGGSWQSRYGKAVMRGLVGDLLARGWAVWNIEYRRVGGRGGWPETFLDVAAAIDHLPTLAEQHRLDLGRVGLLGHSAGGHLALWAASRANLPTGSPGAETERSPRVRFVVAQAAVCDLSRAGRSTPSTAAQLMGGTPAQVPERYALADPMLLLAPSAPVLLVHGTVDATVPVEHSRAYARAAREAGAEVTLRELAGPHGSHRAHIEPRGEAWSAVTQWLDSAPDAFADPGAPVLAEDGRSGGEVAR